MLKIENACTWFHIWSCWLTDQIHSACISWLYFGNYFDYYCFKAATLSPLQTGKFLKKIYDRDERNQNKIDLIFKKM